MRFPLRHPLGSISPWINCVEIYNECILRHEILLVEFINCRADLFRLAGKAK